MLRCPDHCIICDEPCPGFLCGACGRSYDRNAHDEGSVAEAMAWAAARATRLRKTSRHRGSLVSISFDADDLVMLCDRVAAGAEVSEEDGWAELLDKIKAAQRKLRAVANQTGRSR